MFTGRFYRPVCVFILMTSSAFAAQAQSPKASEVTPQSTSQAALDDAVIAAIAFSEALNNGDIDALNSSIDLAALGNKVAQQMFSKKSDISDFMTGFNSAVNKRRMAGNLFYAVLQQEFFAQYIRVLNEDGARRPLVRIDYATGGHEYIILYVTPQQKIEDAFLATSGKLLSDTLLQTTSMMISPNKSMFGNLFGGMKIDKELMNDFKRIGQLRQAGEIQKAYDLINQLPDEIKNQRVMVDLSIILSQSLSDDEYKKQLKRLATYFGDDPTTQFMLVDHHVLTGDLKSTLNALQNVTQRFGYDGAMADLIANVYFEMEQNTDAIEAAKRGIEVEPSFEGPYWTLLGIHLQTNNFNGVANALTLIQSALGYQFTAESLAAEPGFAAFIDSAVYQQWIQEQG